ncbi:hypothetical protein DB30_07894 [Enhygromyxa salina]|uniref:Uncharacterized protein n=1 Tax=Enhygromyxa salina TaxID=215803 RepID=A0A0C2CR89_9BACT|nr:hypothetical protein [Enhygromyxa salina]KIG13686.1 hypothetical protein DB30_07894 [Enhygromyxa salina]
MSDAPPAKPHDPATSGFWWIPGGLLAATGALIVLWWVWPVNEEVREISAELATAPATDVGAELGLDLPPEPRLDLGGSDSGAAPPADPFSSYVLETDGGVAASDADPPEPDRHHYHRETPFEWTLRPSHSVGPISDVGVRGYAFVDGGSAGLPLALDPLGQISEAGAILLSGKIGQLGLEPGRYTIALAVGRANALPVQAQELLAPSPDAPAGAPTWVVRRVELVIED